MDTVDENRKSPMEGTRDENWVSGKIKGGLLRGQKGGRYQERDSPFFLPMNTTMSNTQT
jgi:hypothetical protein